jgi:hypothetical protein
MHINEQREYSFHFFWSVEIQFYFLLSVVFRQRYAALETVDSFSKYKVFEKLKAALQKIKKET